MRHFLLHLILALSISRAFAADAPSVTLPGAEPVTSPEEIKSLLNDLTIYGRYTDGTNWIEYHQPNGRSAYWEKGCTSPGTWWVERSQICYAYPNYRHGAPNCFLLFRLKAGVQFVSVDDNGNAQLSSTSTKLSQGNSEHLPLSDSVQCLNT